MDKVVSNKVVDAYRAAYLRGMLDAADLAAKLNAHYSGFTGTVYVENVERAIRRAAAIAKRVQQSKAKGQP